MGTNDLKICDQIKLWQVFLNHLCRPLIFAFCSFSFHSILKMERKRGEIDQKEKTRGEKVT